MGCDILKMPIDQHPHLVFPGGVIELVHLEKKALTQIASTASDGIKFRNARERVENLRLSGPRNHHNIWNRSAKIPIVVDVLDENLRQHKIFFGDIGERNLILEVFLKSFGLHLSVKHRLASGLHVWIDGSAVRSYSEVLQVLQIVVSVGIVCGKSPFSGCSRGGEIKFLAGNFVTDVLFRQFGGKISLDWTFDVLDDGIAPHLLLEFSTQVQCSQFEHTQGLTHLRCQNLRLHLPLVLRHVDALRH